MAGINVREQIIQEFTDSFNNKICEGNFLLVSMDRWKNDESVPLEFCKEVSGG